MSHQIIMVAGLPGTGKSDVCEKLEERLTGYDLYSLLGVRRDLGHKRYRPSQREVVFHVFYSRTRWSLQNRRGVILDNPYASRSQRKLAYDISSDYGVDVLIIECYCSEKLAKKRMRSRLKKGDLISEPRNPKPYYKLAKRWQDIKKDLQEFPRVPLSYIRYNTENNSLEEVRVSPSMQQLVGNIKQILLQG